MLNVFIFYVTKVILYNIFFYLTESYTCTLSKNNKKAFKSLKVSFEKHIQLNEEIIFFRFCRYIKREKKTTLNMWKS